MNVEAVLTAILATAFLSAMPLALASVGEAIGERAGLLNLGIEGMMLLGAFGGFWVALESGSLALGLAAGAAAGIGAGTVFGLVAVLVGADQVLLGLGITLGGGGLTGFLFREAYGSSQPLLPETMDRPLAAIGREIPVLGPAVLGQPWFFYAAWALIASAALVLRRSMLGLRIRAAGEAPDAVDAVGASVHATRMWAAILAGAFAGLAGASLSLVELGFFQPNVTLGLGFIAIAVTMLSRWSPARIVVFSLLFGILRGMGAGLQLTDLSLSSDLLRLLPYLGVIVALIITGRGIRLPAALGETWSRAR